MAISDLQANTNATLESVEIVEKGDVREFSSYGKLGSQVDRLPLLEIRDRRVDHRKRLWLLRVLRQIGAQVRV